MKACNRGTPNCPKRHEMGDSPCMRIPTDAAVVIREGLKPDPAAARETVLKTRMMLLLGKYEQAIKDRESAVERVEDIEVKFNKLLDDAMRGTSPSESTEHDK
jgi:lipopolysaccharide biosynthesis regulator YciM